MSKDNGGPVFPAGVWSKWGDSEQGGMSGGMTLRDYFAAKALQACFVDDSNIHGTADLAYRIADAMLKAREA